MCTYRYTQMFVWICVYIDTHKCLYNIYLYRYIYIVPDIYCTKICVYLYVHGPYVHTYPQRYISMHTNIHRYKHFLVPMYMYIYTHNVDT